VTLSRRTDPLRFIAVRLAVPELEQVVRQPGIGEAYRVTIQYHDGRSPDQVATLSFVQASGGMAALAIHYRRADDRPLILTPTIPLARARTFTSALRALAFDKLDDMPDVPWYGADLWLVERASGSFHHDLVLAPDKAVGVHAQIVALVREHMREMARAIST